MVLHIPGTLGIALTLNVSPIKRDDYITSKAHISQLESDWEAYKDFKGKFRESALKHMNLLKLN